MSRTFLILSVFLFKGVQCAVEETEQLATTYQVGGGILMLVCLIGLIALCMDSAVDPGQPLPAWVSTIQVDPALDKGYMGCSDGLNIINPNTVHRHRRGQWETDGARWGAPLSKGKHLFEIYWPSQMRGTMATVGVGSETAPLFVKPKDSLVGCNKQSWGLDIARRRLIHNGQLQGGMPKNGFVPDKFFMYVDCDSATVGFGSEISYWGAPLRISREAFPIYAMIGTMCEGSQVVMIYRGSESRYQGQPQVHTVVVPSMAPGGVVHVAVVNPEQTVTEYKQ